MTVAAQLGRPVGATGDMTRRRIIAAAMACVAEKGYSQASIREIARAAQITSGSLYHYFPNKLKALRDTIADIVDDAVRHGRLAADSDPAGTVNAIYALTRGLTEQAANSPPEGYRATLRAAKQLIRGTLLQGAAT